MMSHESSVVSPHHSANSYLGIGASFLRIVTFSKALRLSKLKDDDIPNGGACVRAGTKLTGKIVLDLPKTKTLTEKLELSLEAEEEIYRPDGGSDKTLHQFWHHSMTVRNWSTENPQTLSKGVYGLPFEIDLPASLPCSMSCVKGVIHSHSMGGMMGSSSAAAQTDQCWIRYQLKASLGPKRICTKFIGIIPAASDAAVNDNKEEPSSNPNQIGCTWFGASLLIGAKVDRSVYSLGNKILLSISVLNGIGNRRTESLDVELHEFCSWTTDPNTEKDLLETPRYKRCLYHTEVSMNEEIAFYHTEVSMNEEIAFFQPTIQQASNNGGATPDDSQRQEEAKMTKNLGCHSTRQNDSSHDDMIRVVNIPIYGNARLSCKTSSRIRVWHCVVITPSTGRANGGTNSLKIPLNVVY
jgi:hypothetical protein